MKVEAELTLKQQALSKPILSGPVFWKERLTMVAFTGGDMLALAD